MSLRGNVVVVSKTSANVCVAPAICRVEGEVIAMGSFRTPRTPILGLTMGRRQKPVQARLRGSRLAHWRRRWTPTAARPLPWVQGSVLRLPPGVAGPLLLRQPHHVPEGGGQLATGQVGVCAPKV